MKKITINNAEALAYVRSSLAQGDSLAQLLLSLPLPEGELFTYSHRDHPEDLWLGLERGGVMGQKETESWLLPCIADYLRGSPWRYAVFETLARPRDPSLQKTRYFMVHEDEIYYYSPYDSELGDIIEMVRFARCYPPKIGVLSEVEELVLKPGAEIGADLLHELVRGCDYLVVGAWDNEGVLVWRRPH